MNAFFVGEGSGFNLEISGDESLDLQVSILATVAWRSWRAAPSTAPVSAGLWASRRKKWRCRK